MVNNKKLELVGGQETKKDEDGSSWSELPPDLLSLIIPSLFVRDHVAVHSTCKSWQSITDPPLSPYPYVIFENRNTCLFKFYKPICDAWYQEDIPELSDADIRFSKDNWFLMSTGLGALFLFNPITKARTEIPDIPLEHKDGVERMCFSSTPTSPDCVVFGFLSLRYCRMEVYTYKLGEEGWKVLVYNEGQRFDFYLADCSPVVYNGLVYCLGKMGNLGIFDPTNGDPSWSVCVKPSQRLKNSERRYLVENEGNLYSVFLRCDGREVEVLQLNLNDLRWKDVESLGDTILFVSRYSSFAINSVVRGTGNKVYFPMFNVTGLNFLCYPCGT